MWGVGCTLVQRGCSQETVRLQLRNLCKALAVIDHYDDDYQLVTLRVEYLTKVGVLLAAISTPAIR